MTVREFLVFRLAGPMAAFGKIAVGEQRDIWGEPSKSGVLGLVAGAMGLTRDAAAAHSALETGLGFAVRIDAHGHALRDYHTAQAPKSRKDRRWRTRRDELADRDDLNTVLSERLYRLEARATVALWRKAEPGPDLAALKGALERPNFIPYLGRKSCPLGEPPRPEVVAASTLMAAFDAYDAGCGPADAQVSSLVAPGRRPDPAAERPVWFEMAAGLTDEDAQTDLVRERRDAPRDRVARRFADRREGRLMWRRDLLQGIVA